MPGRRPVMELDGGPVTVATLSALALYNYGHFTTMVVEGMRVRGLARHLRRLEHDCRELFGADLDTERVRALVRRAAARSPDPVVVRVTVFDPDFDLGHPAATGAPRILVTTRAVPAGTSPPLRLATATYGRDLPGVKHAGLLGALHLRRRSQRDGYDDVLFVDGDGRIGEGATWNIGFASDDRVRWPRAEQLPGVTQAVLEEVLSRAGIRSEVAPLALADLPDLGSPFVTNATVGVRPVSRIDDHTVTADPALVARLAAACRAAPGDPL